jgi:hypothetical protein
MREHPARARAMARAGRKRVEALCSLATKVQRTEALYRRLLAGAAASGPAPAAEAGLPRAPTPP